jgi:hypothetical protein
VKGHLVTQVASRTVNEVSVVSARVIMKMWAEGRHIIQSSIGVFSGFGRVNRRNECISFEGRSGIAGISGTDTEERCAFNYVS